MTNWVLTIARNNLNLTKKAVASFLAQDIGDVRVLLIDNASTDGTAQWMAGLDERVFLCYFSTQQSVAYLWNFGLDWCFRGDAKYVLVANNDVELQPCTFRLLVEDGGPFVTGVGVNTREQATTVDPQNRRPHPDYSCFKITREAFARVRFDERYKIGFCEDAASHVELHRAGIEAYCIGVPFYHVGSATVKNADPKEHQRIHEQAEKNRELFYQTYGERIGTPGYSNLFRLESFGINR